MRTLASIGRPGLIGARLPAGAPGPFIQRGFGAVSSLLSPPPQPAAYNSAAAVAVRFERFLRNIALTDAQFADGETKLRTVTSCLNRAYWGHNDENLNRVLAGSWSKQTRVRPPRDIDMLFVLPYAVYARYEQRAGNKQSQLLQEIRGFLLQVSPRTEMSGDGQVVLVKFDSYAVEVAPAFLLDNYKQYWICDTNNGGRYKVADPAAEVSSIEFADKGTIGNVRRLTRMMKKWQKYCNVPLKSFWIELLAADFLRQWQYRAQGHAFHDWMVRDFLTFLLGRRFTYLTVPGTFELIWLGDKWYSKAVTAYRRAMKACDLEYEACPYLARDEWQGIFGPDFQG
ncbi:MAG: nucleotidyltransferase [Betaproteobacteria bacterium]|nr:MAG: nucleotidyltransferase [Betaproteobacteria bacterium]